MDRRKFLKTGAAAAAVASFDFPALARRVKPAKSSDVRLKVGVLSDVHVQNAESRERFKKALEYYKAQKVDAVMIAGDLTEYGLIPEYRDMAAAWFEVFPDDKYPDGTKVERLFIYGNHEVEAWNYGFTKKRYDEATRRRDAIAPVRDVVWEECWGEKFQPIYMKEVKGYKFIGAHHVRKHIPGLEEFLASAGLPKDKPFFYFQHAHPKGTCSSPWVTGQDDGTVTEILSKYPNAVAFSGHSHAMLTDERTVWQGAFTSIGTGSLHYITAIGGRENFRLRGSKDPDDARMPLFNGREGHHGQLMTVYDDRIVLEKLEFGYDEHLGTVVIPLDGGEKPWSFEERAAKEPAPQFSPGAEVKVEGPVQGKNRRGKVCDQMKVSFSKAVSHDGLPRPLDYEVQIEVAGVDVYKAVLTKRVYSNTCFLGEKKDSETLAFCAFGLDELPKEGSYRYAVRPCNAYGRKGEPIYSEVITCLSEAEK